MHRGRYRLPTFTWPSDQLKNMCCFIEKVSWPSNSIHWTLEMEMCFLEWPIRLFWPVVWWTSLALVVAMRAKNRMSPREYLWQFSVFFIIWSLFHMLKCKIIMALRCWSQGESLCSGTTASTITQCLDLNLAASWERTFMFAKMAPDLTFFQKVSKCANFLLYWCLKMKRTKWCLCPTMVV